MLRVFLTSFFIGLVAVINAFGAEADSGLTAVTPKLSPDRIEVGTFYDGATVEVTANIPACDGAALILEAGKDEITLNRKGRVAGIWLNVAQVTVKNVPTVYILAASDTLEKLCVPETRQKTQLGKEYLRKQIQFDSDKPLTGEEFDEFLKLKTESGSYKMDLNIDLSPAGAGKMKLAATLPVAPTIPPGVYKVVLYCFSGGQPLCRGEAKLTVVRVGLARLMANMARDHAAEYGIMAIVVAMAVGILMGVVFSSRSAH